MNPRKVWVPEGIDAVAQHEYALKKSRSESVEFHPHAEEETCKNVFETSQGSFSSLACWTNAE